MDTSASIDSLRTIWNDISQPDTCRLLAIQLLIENGYRSPQADCAFFYLEQQYLFAEAKNQQHYMATATSEQALNYWRSSEYDLAIGCYNTCISLWESLGDRKAMVNDLNALAGIYFVQGKYDLSLQHCTNGWKIMQEIGDQQGIAKALNNIANIFVTKGAYVEALDHYQQSLEIDERTGNKAGKAASLGGIGNVYKVQGDYGSAIKNLMTCLRLYEELDNKMYVANTLINIGNIYHYLLDHTRAATYYEKSLKIFEEIGDQRGLSDALICIGNTQSSLKNHASSINYYKRSLKIKQAIGNRLGEAMALNNIGKSYAENTEHDAAIYHYEQSKAIYQELEIHQGIATSLINIGCSFAAEGNELKALSYCNDGLKIALDIGAIMETKEAAKSLWKIYKKQGDYMKALQMYEMFINTRDSMNSEENNKVIIRQEMKYQHEKAELLRQQQQAELTRSEQESISRRDNLQYSVILILLLFVFGGVLSLGFIKVSPKATEGLIFFSFLILFEFLLVLIDPYVDQYSGGAPGYKLLFNAVLAGGIFPLHAFFEKKLKFRLIRKN